MLSALVIEAGREICDAGLIWVLQIESKQSNIMTSYFEIAVAVVEMFRGELDLT